MSVVSAVAPEFNARRGEGPCSSYAATATFGCTAPSQAGSEEPLAAVIALASRAGPGSSLFHSATGRPSDLASSEPVALSPRPRAA
jgi:hypothetical protein